MSPGITNSFGLGGRERGVPEVSRWNLDLFDNEIHVGLQYVVPQNLTYGNVEIENYA